MDIRCSTTTTESWALIGMVHCYRDILLRRSNVLAPLTEAYSVPKGRKILCNGALEDSFKGINRMVSSETLLSYPDCTIPFTFHADACDKQLGAVISQNNKPIVFFSRILINPQRNYTTTKKKLLAIVEFPRDPAEFYLGMKYTYFHIIKYGLCCNPEWI